jgi:hypothetical protein
MISVTAKPAPSRWRAFRRWPLALGATGFACGYFGPIALAPEANQGPLLGIFVTGPGGVLLGVVLGAVAVLLPLSERQRRGALWVACAVVGLATLYWSTPPPAYRGEIVDGEVRGCHAAASMTGTAVHTWEQRVAAAPWGKPRPNWKQEAERRLRDDRGLVVDLQVARVRRVYENAKPWNKGSFVADPWAEKDESRQYYAKDSGTACVGYLQAGSVLYFPTSDPDQAWPPADVPDLLLLQILSPVPTQYQRFASR